MTPDDSSHQQPGAAEPLGVLRAELLAAVLARWPAGGAAGTARTAGRTSARLQALLARDGPVTLERPRRAEFGDYSTNAALLLAPVLGSQAARARRAPRRGARRAAAAEPRALRGGGPGLPEPVPVRRLADGGARRRCSPPGARFGAGGAPAPRADPRRVRLGQPDRADARRPRPQRRLRRRARAHARLPRPQRGAGVLRQRRRLPDAQVRRVDQRAGARRGSRPRTATTATTWPSSPRRIPGAGERRPGRRRPRGRGRDGAEACRTSLAAFRVQELRPLDLRERAARGRAEPGRAHARDPRRGGAHLHAATGALWLRTHRVRRRQGPRAGALQRRAHLLRLRHRLPPGQARARLRAPDRRLGRRPPRLPAAHEGRLRGARRRSRRARAADHAARAPAARAASARRCPSGRASS